MAFVSAPPLFGARSSSARVRHAVPMMRYATRRDFAKLALLSTLAPTAVSAAPARPVYEKDESGISYYDLKTGTGNYPNDGDFVTIDYTAFLSNGQIFDNRKNFVFQYGRRQVVPGIEAAVASMRVGGERRAVLPPDLAYGSKGVCFENNECLIPPNETLGYDISLLRVALPPT